MNYAQLLFPDFSLILCGFLVCRYTSLNRTVWQQVDALVYFFLFPVLLFQSISKTTLDLRAASSLIGAGWTLGAIAIADVLRADAVSVIEQLRASGIERVLLAAPWVASSTDC